MAGNVSPESAPRNRYIPRGHPVSWWMLAVTTGAILICLFTLVPISMIRETSAGQEEAAVPQGT